MCLNKSNLHFLFIFLIVALLSCNQSETVQPESVNGQPDVFEESGMLVFKDEGALNATLEKLYQFSSEELKSWNEQHNFVSLKQIFDEIVDAEWAINDHYESLLNEGMKKSEIPFKPVHSKQYLDGLAKGFIRIVTEEDGEYFDYNIYETEMSPILNKDGMVKVGTNIFQFTLEEKKIFSNEKKINMLKKESENNLTDDITVLKYVKQYSSKAFRTSGQSNSWRYYSKPGNGWTNDGNRRFRAWVEGSSSITGDYKLYVTNLVRIEGQKKNIFGTWGYRETYYATANLNWHWYYRINYNNKNNLNSSSFSAPLNWSSNYVNNASIGLAPHTSGYYQLSGVTVSDVIDAVEVSLTGTASIHGKSWELLYTN